MKKRSSRLSVYDCRSASDTWCASGHFDVKRLSGIVLMLLLPLLAGCQGSLEADTKPRIQPRVNDATDATTGTDATDTALGTDAVDTASAVDVGDSATETVSTDTTDTADTAPVSTDTSDTANVDDAFVTTWNTEVEFYEQYWIDSPFVRYESSGPFPFPDPNQIDLPLVEEGHYNFSVDWGDGTSDIITSWNASARRHTYASAGLYDVSIRGEISGWSFKQNDYDVRSHGEQLAWRKRVVQTPRLIEIKRFGPLTLGHAGGQFYGCENLNISATDSPKLIENADISHAFNGCSFSGTVEMNHWQTESVTNMAGMFAGASHFNSPIDSWNTHNVTDMSQMFSGASAFNQDVSAWQTGNVTNMSEMFNGASAFNQDVGAWNTGNVTNMLKMFNEASSFNQDVSAWNIEKVTDMSEMFVGVTLETDIYDNILDSWSQQAVQKGIDISFGSSTKFTSYAAREKLIDEDGWRITDGGIGAEPGTGTIPAIPQTEPFISKWARVGLPGQGATIKLPLVENGDYFFMVDWGDGQKHIVTSWNDPDATHFLRGNPDSDADDTTQVTITGRISGWKMKWRRGEDLHSICCTNTDHESMYDLSSIWYGESWSGASRESYSYCCFPPQGSCCGYVRALPAELVEISQWGSLALGPTESQFANCEGFTITATDAPDLSDTTSLHGIFKNCHDFTGLESLNHWDVSTITDMSHMFYEMGYGDDPESAGCPDLSNWDTSNVQNMDHLFFHFYYPALPCPIDVSNWDTSNVVNMNSLFFQSGFSRDDLCPDVSNWDTSRVTDMTRMFSALPGCSNFDFSHWDTSSVLDMNNMFSWSENFNADVSSWNIENVNNMSDIFRGTSLTPEIYDNILNAWAAQAVQEGVTFSAGVTQYTSAAADARQSLIDDHGWTINDGGML